MIYYEFSFLPLKQSPQVTSKFIFKPLAFFLSFCKTEFPGESEQIKRLPIRRYLIVSLRQKFLYSFRERCHIDHFESWCLLLIDQVYFLDASGIHFAVLYLPDHIS